jgi:hypothetical protein
MGAIHGSALTAGLDPEIHAAKPHIQAYVRPALPELIMDARVKPAHDAAQGSYPPDRNLP